jgi:SHS2 domain-containing protein
VHRWVEHTAELELELEAPTEEGLFADALTAFAELVGRDGAGRAVSHEISVSASDRAALLVEWLGELVFLAETEDFVPERVAALDLRDGELRATLEGRRGEPAHLVKSVTYHGLELGRAETGWRARVVLDV